MNLKVRESTRWCVVSRGRFSPARAREEICLGRGVQSGFTVMHTFLHAYEQTRFKVYHDHGDLVIAVSPSDTVDRFDHGDSIEIFFDSLHDHLGFYQFAFDGAVGQVLTLEANAHYIGGRTYFHRWNRLQRMGGGLWITKSCHDLDILYWLAGKRPLAIAAFDDLAHYLPRTDAPLHCRDCREKQTWPDAYPKAYAADFIRLAEALSGTPGKGQTYAYGTPTRIPATTAWRSCSSRAARWRR